MIFYKKHIAKKQTIITDEIYKKACEAIKNTVKDHLDVFTTLFTRIKSCGTFMLLH